MGELPRPAAEPGRALPGPVGALVEDALAPAPCDRPTAAEFATGLAALAGPSERLATAA